MSLWFPRLVDIWYRYFDVTKITRYSIYSSLVNILQVVDLKFLEGCARPTVAVLSQNSKAERHIKTYELLVKDKVTLESCVPWCSGSGLYMPLADWSVKTLELPFSGTRCQFISPLGYLEL